MSQKSEVERKISFGDLEITTDDETSSNRRNSEVYLPDYLQPDKYPYLLLKIYAAIGLSYFTSLAYDN